MSRRYPILVYVVIGILIGLLIYPYVTGQAGAQNGACGQFDPDHIRWSTRCHLEQHDREIAALRQQVAALQQRPPAGLSRDEVWRLAKDAAFAVLLENRLVKP